MRAESGAGSKAWERQIQTGWYLGILGNCEPQDGGGGV